MTPARPVMVAGNWKMNLRRRDAAVYCQTLALEWVGRLTPEVVLFPPFPLIPVVAESLADTSIRWGGQDLHPRAQGAHTGDVSAFHLLDWGCTWVLCGHSERRLDHTETDRLIGEKVVAAQVQGLAPILCLGETLEERDEGRTEETLRRQLQQALPEGNQSWALAYEPVWAIGSGQTATPELAQSSHSFLRRIVRELAGDSLADGLRILYGGSVTAQNCDALLQQPDIDGFLVGGASLDPHPFLDIIRRCDVST